MFSVFCSSLALGQWDSVEGGAIGGSVYSIYAQQSYAGKLYVGGQFHTVNRLPASGLATWDGNNWNVFSELNIPGGNSYVAAFTIYNGNLVACGEFDSIGGLKASSSVATWNGTSWSCLGKGVVGLAAAAVYNGNLYVGGYANGYIYMWNGSTWNIVGKGIKSKANADPARVLALQVYNGNLYVAGHFDSAGGKYVRNLAMWNGTVWSAVNNNMKDSGIGSLTVFNGELYAGGFILLRIQV
jgi:hypothetical protein